MEAHHILVVDDEPHVCELIQLYLENNGCQVTLAHDGRQALELARRERPDLIVLDLMLPEIDGWEVCREIRKESTVPIIMLSARSEDVDKILGLELGADDYLTKPFNPRELMARIRAVLRRTSNEDQQPDEIISIPGLTINSREHEVRLNEEVVNLTPKEFDLLWLMASNAGRVFSREQLLEQVWGYDFFGDERTIDVHIKRLRQKLETKDNPYRYIQTVWGIGYKFEVVECEASS
ncbi:MAG: response regulator [Limnochordia bacterium]|jgi:DNA-binding response OmpR family regulator